MYLLLFRLLLGEGEEGGVDLSLGGWGEGGGGGGEFAFVGSGMSRCGVRSLLSIIHCHLFASRASSSQKCKEPSLTMKV